MEQTVTFDKDPALRAELQIELTKWYDAYREIKRLRTQEGRKPKDVYNFGSIEDLKRIESLAQSTILDVLKIKYESAAKEVARGSSYYAQHRVEDMLNDAIDTAIPDNALLKSRMLVSLFSNLAAYFALSAAKTSSIELGTQGSRQKLSVPGAISQEVRQGLDKKYLE